MQVNYRHRVGHLQIYLYVALYCKLYKLFDGELHGLDIMQAGGG